MPAKSRRPGSKGTKPGPAGEAASFVAQALPGLAPFVAAELTGPSARIESVGEDEVRFRYEGARERLLRLRRAVAVFAVIRFDVPRPRALTGHAHLTRLAGFIAAIREGYRGSPFDGFRIAAAGSDSPVFTRLAEEIERLTGLVHRPEEGDLLLRIRPAPGGGWEVLGRLTPRPLSTREWRQCNLAGGLNATVAAGVHDMLGVSERDRYLNLMCGSGTLLIERALAGGWRAGVGVDLDREALDCCRSNVLAAGVERRVELLAGDATRLELESDTFDRLSADLPWGDAVGDHAGNAELYPAFLAESARVAARGARMAVITHELRLFEKVLSDQRAWRQRELRRVFHGGHRPGIFILDLRR